MSLQPWLRRASRRSPSRRKWISLEAWLPLQCSAMSVMLLQPLQLLWLWSTYSITRPTPVSHGPHQPRREHPEHHQPDCCGGDIFIAPVVFATRIVNCIYRYRIRRNTSRNRSATLPSTSSPRSRQDSTRCPRTAWITSWVSWPPSSYRSMAGTYIEKYTYTYLLFGFGFI